jgi:hypothetical protein
MKRWRLGCLLVLLLGLIGCESVDPPRCYDATFSLENPQGLQDLRAETDGSTVTLINTATPTATLMFSDLYFTDPGSRGLAGQFPGTLRRATPDRLVIKIWDIKEFRDQPQYPNCDQSFPATSPAVVLVSHAQQRQLVTLRVTYHPTDPAIIAQYREYERESNSQQRMFDGFIVFICLLGFMLFIGVITLLVWVAKRFNHSG